MHTKTELVAIATLSLLAFFHIDIGAQPCRVTADDSWRATVELPDDPFVVNPFPNPRWVKFAILLCDPTIVYFQNSREFAFHYDFATSHLDPFSGLSRSEFDAVTLHLDGQEAILGAIILPPSTRPIPEFGIQFVGHDPYPAELIIELFGTVRDRVEGDELEAYYFPTFEQSSAAEENAEALAAGGVRVASADRWSDGNAIYSEGWALGTLRFVPVDEIEAAYLSGALRPTDILLTDGVPAEIPFVAGILSLKPATPNSHVAILAKNFGVPFVYLSQIDDAERAQALDGRQSIVAAYSQFSGGSDVDLYDIEGQLSQDTIDEILALKALPPLDIAPLRTAAMYGVDTSGLSPEAIDIVGGKAANYSLLRTSIPDNSRKAAAVTMDAWTEFLSQSLENGNTLREEIDERLAPFTTYPPSDISGLADALDGVRDLFRDPLQTAFSTAVQDAVIETLQNPVFEFDPARRIRVRSSSNFEDSAQFTAAGLFESRSGCLLDDLDGDASGPSHCNASRPTEQGVFRAIRRVYASFYNDNAYLERRRWGVQENEVGMGLLLHHSFPDEFELANGVATLTRSGPNYRINMVSQVGSTSVANPTDGSVPEHVLVTVFRSGSVFTELLTASNLVVLGDHVLDWRADYDAFGGLFVEVAKAFEEATGKEQYSLDFEFKKVVPDPGLPEGPLIIKQVRELPQVDRTPSITPFLLNEPTPLTTFQEEYGSVFSNHRLKSEWRIETEDTWLTEDALAAGIFTQLRLDYTDGCGTHRFDGEVIELPQVSQGYDPRLKIAQLGWRFDGLANGREYTLEAYVPLLSVAPTQNPFLTLSDLQVFARATYEHEVLGWNGFELIRTREEAIRLAPEIPPHLGELEQLRIITDGDVTVTTRFYWPAPPTGIVAGYTAPLIRWIETIIEGVTTEPIVLTGDRSQTYRPEHHNFGENFMFSPFEEEGIPSSMLEELEARGVHWIQVYADAGNDRVTLHGACEIPVACVCPVEAPRFVRGDCDGDGQASGVVTDAVFLLSYLFLGAPAPACLAACDVNGDGVVAGSVTDAVYALTFNFLGGPTPPAPYPDCDEGGIADAELGCGDYDCIELFDSE